MERLLALGSVEARSRFAAVAGGTLHYLEAGRGPALVLLHGASGGAANWYRLLGPLSRTHRVLALDLPGFGLSDPMPLDAPLGVQLARLIEEWLARIGALPCVLVGTSFGGLAALRVAQRVATQVRALVLIDSVGLGREAPVILRLACRSAFARWAVHPSRAGLHWQFRRLMVAQPQRIPLIHRQSLLEYLYQSAAAADATQLARAYTLFADWRGQREILTDHELRSLQLPLLVLWGERDRFLRPRHARRVAELVPQATLRMIPGAGHSPNWEAPEQVLEYLTAFLSQQTN